MVEHWLKDGKRCLEHTELTYDLAQRTLTTVETGGETTFRRWNEQQQIIEYTNALNETWWFEWDTSRLLTKNGVFLPNRNNVDEALSGIKHNGRHPSDYIDAVNTRIIDADKLNGKQGVLDELSKIRDILSSANRDASWYTIL
ncbi:AHH domain-containing protein [Escherichia coli]|uniref:AHH domain-containing protein n=1 Tax=Proteus TaxID=583 RepID=UPI000B9FB91A|nr:AHH domain-containing protein [Proteus mirabilis]AWR61121.1 hypothetical protein CLH65_17870 [Proteus mirabilis]OZS64805.1 hypothetical protein CHI96_18105 [Proteus mirabilis]